MNILKYILFPLILFALILMGLFWVILSTIHNIAQVSGEIYSTLRAIYET